MRRADEVSHMDIQPPTASAGSAPASSLPSQALLCARVAPERDAGIDVSTFRRDALLACVADLRRHGLALGDCVAVSAAGGVGVGHVGHVAAVGVVFPSKQLRAGAVAMTPIMRLNAGVGIGDSVVISRIPDALLTCVRVTVRFDAEEDGAGSDGAVMAHVAAQMEDRVISIGSRYRIGLYGRTRQFQIVSVDAPPLVSLSRSNSIDSPSSPFYRTSRQTKYIPASDASRPPAVPSAQTDNASRARIVGGLATQMAAIREVVELPLTRPELYARLGLPRPRGVLLYGPPGTGKTLIARSVASECKCHVVCVNGPELVSKFYGETEANLRAVFAEAASKAPAIVFIDEIDAICPRREDGKGESEKRVVGTLLTLMDGAEEKSSGGDHRDGGDQSGAASSPSRPPPPHVVVIGATNRVNSLDPALRRPGRFDVEIEIGIPSASARLDILHVLMRDIPHSVAPDDLEAVAARTHGYVGADIAALVKEAALCALKRSCVPTPRMGGEAADMETVVTEAVVTTDDLHAAAAAIAPSAMREVAVEVPTVRWDDIGGQAETKQRLREAVEWPLRHPDAFVRMGVRPPKGILLYGPPGCSKTLMAKALATESGLNFIAVKGPQLFSKWVGESERAVREVFRKARAASPSIVFFDEIDSMAGARSDGGSSGGGVFDRVLSQLLSELDGIEARGHVTVVAATNRPDLIDKALLRPGRIDRMIYVAPPDEPARDAIFRIALRRTPLDASVSIASLATASAGRSGAEIGAICREAALCAMEDDLGASTVTAAHFARAMKRIPGQITDAMLQFYDNYRTKFGTRG